MENPTESDQRSYNINTEVNLEDFLQQLENDKLRLANEGKYEEAEIMKERIEETKKAIKLKKLRDLDLQHQSEMESLENNYRKELEDCNNKWNEKFNDLEQRSANLERELNLKHEKEMEKLYHFLEDKLPKNIKYSREYLELKDQEEKLVKQQFYKEAAVIKRRIENLERVDNNRWNQDKHDKIKSQSVKTANKHLLEKNALKQKVEAEYELLKRQQQQELDRIVHKYKNRKYDLELQQKNDKLLFDNPNILKSKTTTNKLKDKKTILFSGTFYSSSPAKPHEKTQSMQNYNSNNTLTNNNENSPSLEKMNDIQEVEIPEKESIEA